jgi:8-oxo-dGTP diphosphatase
MRVVAAAVVRENHVLAARRMRPERLAGGWEFAGGKVEPGEDERTALARECAEELSVAIEVGDALGSAEEGEISLVLYSARLTKGEPSVGIDHDAIRWLSAAELEAVSWLPIDRTLIAAVHELLATRGQRSGSPSAESAAATAAPDVTNRTAASTSGER